MLFEGARRGGWSGSSGLRFSTANTPAIPTFFDESQRERTLLDMDVVGVYIFSLIYVILYHIILVDHAVISKHVKCIDPEIDGKTTMYEYSKRGFLN